MNASHRNTVLLLLIGLLIVCVSKVSFAGQQVTVWFFYTDTCPHCHKVLSSGVLEKLPSYATVEYFELSKDRNARELFGRITSAYNIPAAVPTIIIFTDDPYSGRVLQGDEPIINNLLKDVRSAYSRSTSPNNSTGHEASLKERLESNHILLVLATAAADSVNPCIMAVLVLLLAALSITASGHRKGKKNDNIHPRARKQMVRVGVIYTMAVFASYLVIGLLLIAGTMLVFNRLALYSAEIALYTKLFVATMVGVAGIINIKDFFWYGKGVSFILPKKYKLKIQSLAKKATLPAIVSAALIVTIVEFPCSGMMYLGLITYFVASGMSIPVLFTYLILYNIVFVLPLIIITVMATKSISRVEETRMKYRRVFRLVMGVALVLLAILLMVM